MGVAILGAVAGRHVVAPGDHVGQPGVPRNAGVDDRYALTRPAGELPHLRQLKVRQLVLTRRRIRLQNSTNLALRGPLWWGRQRGFGQPSIVDPRRRNRLRRGCSEDRQFG